MKVCSKCGEKFESGKFCKYCGGTLVDEAEETQELHCSKCGAVLAEGSKFCPKCGLETNEYKSKNQKLIDLCQKWIDVSVACDYKEMDRLEHGLIGSMNITELLQAELETHHPSLQYAIGWGYYLGCFGAIKSKDVALQWFTKSYNQGCVRAAFAIGHYYANKGIFGDYKNAAIWLKIAADNNDSWAQVLIAENFFDFPFDYINKLLENAVKAGNRRAMYRLAGNYETGCNGYDKDISRAIELFKKSADLGFELSIKSLKKYGISVENQPLELSDLFIMS